MADHARGWLEEEIEQSRAHAKLLDYLAGTFEAETEHAPRKRKGEVHVTDVIVACMYGAERCRQHASNLEDVRAIYDARVTEPLDGS